MKIKNLAAATAVVASLGLLLGAATSARASLIPLQSGDTDLTLSTPGVVGYANPNSQGGNDELQIAQYILYLNDPSAFTSPVSNPDTSLAYNVSATSYGGGTLGLTTGETGSINAGNPPPTVSGAEFVIAKYGGGNNAYPDGTQGGGYILFYLGNNTVTLPENSYSLWYNTHDPTNTFNISDYTAFNVTGNTVIGNGGGTPIPEPSTVFAAALLLLPFGMSTVRILRKARTA